MSSSRSWGASPRGPGPVSVLRIAGPLPHPHRAGFLAPPDAASLGAKNRPNSPVKGLLYVPGAARRGLVASHCPGPAPQREGSTQPAKPWPSSLRQRWGEGSDWLGHRGGAVGGLFPGVGPGTPWLLNLGLFSWGRSPLPKKKGGGAGGIHPHPAAGQERVWAVLQFWGSRPVDFPHPLFSPRTLLQPTADVYPEASLAPGRLSSFSLGAGAPF